MKKTLIIWFIIVSLTSGFTESLWETLQKEKWIDWIDAYYWIKNNIQQIPDEPGTNYWQSPEETLNRGSGDCEDLCILYMSFLALRFNISSVLVEAEVRWYDGSQFWHMMLRLNTEGRYWRRDSAVGIYQDIRGNECYLVDFMEVWKNPRLILGYASEYPVTNVPAMMSKYYEVTE